MSHVWRSHRPYPAVPGRRRVKWDNPSTGPDGGSVVRPATEAGRRDGRRTAECDRRADLAYSVGDRVNDHRSRMGGGGLDTAPADRPPVMESPTLPAPPRLRRMADAAPRPARRIVVTAASFAIFSTAAFGVVAVTAPEVIGYSRTAGSPVSAPGPAAPPPGSTDAGARPPREPAVEGSGGIMAAHPAAPPRSRRVAGPGSTESGPGSGESAHGARGAVADVNATASVPPPPERTGGATPGGRPDPDTPSPSRGPIGAYALPPQTGSSATPTPSDQPSGTQRPEPDRPGSGTGSAEPTRPGSRTPEAIGG